MDEDEKIKEKSTHIAYACSEMKGSSFSLAEIPICY